jgi:hypothetical protein
MKQRYAIRIPGIVYGQVSEDDGTIVALLTLQTGELIFESPSTTKAPTAMAAAGLYSRNARV